MAGRREDMGGEGERIWEGRERIWEGKERGYRRGRREDMGGRIKKEMGKGRSNEIAVGERGEMVGERCTG